MFDFVGVNESLGALMHDVWAQARLNHARFSATGDRENDIRFHTIGMCGEVGEVANLVKKRWRDGDGHDEEIRREIADVLAYAFMLADQMGLSPTGLLSIVSAKQQEFVLKMKRRGADGQA